MRIRPSLSLLAGAVCVTSLLALPAAAAPKVVATIPPVHSIVAGVMAGLGEPALLLEGGASPHTYSLRPSDARLLNEADVVFWVGDELETFLERPLATLAASAAVVALIESDAIERLPIRSGGAWEAHEHADGEHAHEEHADHGHDEDGHDEEHAGEAHEHDEHAHGATDPHLWLSSRNARAIARIAAEALARKDPVNAAAYAANAERVVARLDALDGEIEAIIAPVHARPYIVFHDAYQYFERAYRTGAVGAITVSPDQQPGAKRLSEIRDRISGLDVACVFHEPQFPPALADTVTRGTGARAGVLDPLGATLKPGPDLYDNLMRNLARSLAGCLSGSS